jgi:hypothetical protein
MPPAIVKINGEDAATLIARSNVEFSNFQDPDSMWNAGFPTYATPNSLTFVAASINFRGTSTTVTYDNGEEKTEDNFAIIRRGANFSGIETGEDFYNRFCNPNLAAPPGTPTTSSTMSASTSTSSSTSSATSSTTPPAPGPTIDGYPTPIVRDNGANITSGYFLEGAGYDDVAVISFLAFAPASTFNTLEYLKNFQSTVRTFLAKSKEAGKKKLVIDVTGNGGGAVITAFEFFTQVRVSSPQMSAIRMSNCSYLSSFPIRPSSNPTTSGPRTH